MAVRLEDAAKCPKCGTPGKIIGVSKNHSFEKGAWWDLVVYQCDQKLCIDSGFTWLVQSDKDGHVFERDMGTRGMDKTFEPMSADQLAYGRMIVEDAIGREHNRES